jgi:hypothetical protein
MMRFNKIAIVFLFMALFSGHGFPGSYYVAANGDNSDSGSIDHPWATIQYAADSVDAGDTVYIRGGSYHETVNLNAVEGTSANPVVFTNYFGETVVIDGTIPITSSWILHEGSIYKTTLNEDIWQLFVDGEHQTLARFPNAETWSDLMWDRENGRRFESGDGVNGHMVDDAGRGHLDSLAGAGVSFNDCVAVMNLRNWTTYARHVRNHITGADNFDYDLVPNYTTTRAGYFIEGGLGDAELVMLDSPGEWAFDETTKTLYYWAEDGLNPAGRDIKGKNQSYAFNGTSGTKYVIIDGLNFFATTFYFYESEYITVQNCRFDYPTFSKRAIGSISGPDKTWFGGSNSKSNQHCILYNCEFRYVDGPALYYKKSDFTTIENNYFYMVDYGCLDEGYSLNGNNANGTVYRRNTLEISGDSEGCRIGLNNASVYPATVAYNYHTRCGLLQTDGASVQYSPSSANESQNHHNWFIDNDRTSFRFDGDPAGQYGNVYRNVSMTSHHGAFRIKGDFHEVYNNTAVEAVGKLNVALEKGGNANTVTRNNAADSITDWPIPGTASNNYNGQIQGKSMRLLLRDPDNFDFRPRDDAVELVDQGMVIGGITDGYEGLAPDLGAYEYDDTNYFIGGRQLIKASYPVPPNGSANAMNDLGLMWRTALDAQSYDIYFGTQPGNLALQGNQVNNIFTPGLLIDGTTYYWRVDTITAAGVVTGDEWSFTPNFSVVDSKSYQPIDDSYVENTNPNTNYGSATMIELRTSSITDGLTRHGYVKFHLTGINGTVTDARLRLYSAGSNFSGGLSVYGVSVIDWTEEAITWNNRPVIDGTLLDSIGSISEGTWGELDVTDYITGDGIYSLGLIRGVKDSNRRVQSKESAYPVELVVTYADTGNPPNTRPDFQSNTFSMPDAAHGYEYTNSIADQAFDPDQDDTLVFSKTVGPAWLSVLPNGTITGVPMLSDIGSNEFLVRVTDDSGLYDESTMTMTVIAGTNPPNIDGIGKVDMIDFAILARNWLDQCAYPNWCEGADLDISGTVGLDDLLIFTQSWLDE